MTIICYKNNRLAADGLETHGDFITSSNVEKIVVSNQSEKWYILGKRIVAFAACGTVTADITLKKYLSKSIGMEEQFINVCHDLFSALCIDEEGTSYIIETIKDNGVDKLIIVDVKPFDIPVAIGVGSDVSRALMNSHLAFSAYAAVEFNCVNFTSCGGTIKEVDIKEITKKLNN